MKNNEMNKALNIQINKELHSGYIYLSMAAYFKEHNLVGFGKWFEAHAHEEFIHAMKIYNFVIERGWHVNLTQIENPGNDWKSILEILKFACKHEEQITERINKLVKLAIKTDDYATNTFLQWFVSEQIEEEAVFGELLSKIKLAGENSSVILFLDANLESKAAMKKEGGVG